MNVHILEHMLLHLSILKQTYKICNKNISKEKYEKLGKYLKGKTWMKLFCKKCNSSQQKRDFASPKGNFVLQKSTWVIIENCFWQFWFKLGKQKSKRTLFNKASGPRMLYLSKIGPANYTLLNHVLLHLITR